MTVTDIHISDRQFETELQLHECALSEIRKVYMKTQKDMDKVNEDDLWQALDDIEGIAAYAIFHDKNGNRRPIDKGGNPLPRA